MIPALNDSLASNPAQPPRIAAPLLSEEEAERQVHGLKAIADVTRLRILSLLMHYDGEVCVNEIVACFRLEQATISHHLRIMRDAGLIGLRKHGLWSYYFIKWEYLTEVSQTLTNLAQQSESAP